MPSWIALTLSMALGAPLVGAVPADDGALAAELLAQADAPARERWLETHHAELTPALGREVAAQARVHFLASRYEPAYDAFTLALRIGEIAGDPESRIRALEGLGGVERFRGRAQAALPLLERAIVEAEAARDDAAVGRVLDGMGSVRRRLGEYRASLALFERALTIFERLGDPHWQGRAHNGIAIALGALGRCAEALPHLEQDRRVLEAAGDMAGLTNIYNNLGACYQQLGNYRAGLEALGHCIRISETTGKRNELPAPFNNIGNLYRLQGATSRAREYYQRGYAAAAEHGEQEFMAEALANEGALLLELDRPREALGLLERALALGQAIHGPVVWTASESMAEAHWRLGDRRRARELLDACLQAAETTGDVSLGVRARRQLAALQLELGDAAAARDLASRAAELARRHALSEELWAALLVVGRAERALAQTERAEATLRAAVDVVEELRAHAVGPDADRTAFLVQRATPYQELVALLVDGGRPWDALTIAERNKGRVLLDVLAGGRSSIGASQSAGERAAGRRLETDLLTSNAELRALLQRPQPDPRRQQELEEQRRAQRVALEDWQARQYAAHPGLRALRGESRPLGSEDAGRLLGSGRSVLLEYVLSEKQAYLFVLSAGASGVPTLTVHRVAAASAEVARLARDLRQRLATRDLGFGAPAARLHELLLAPAHDALRNAQRVVIVPDEALWELPFQALRPAGGRFLIEDVAVSYAPSLSVLRDMQARQRVGLPTGSLLAVGNPELGTGARRRSHEAAMSSPLEPLPEAETQVHEIAKLYDPRGSAVRVGNGASESWFKSEAAHYRILHLATHGLLDDASPLYSDLVLAAPGAGDEGDGLLEAREILDLELHADLAVLSACETGRGRAGAGEGLIGMSWAFFVAGCPTTIASQWKVEAASTGRLMLAFHRELRAGHAPADALRLAALAQLRRPKQRHPFYWAGFVAMGDAYARWDAHGRTPSVAASAPRAGRWE